MDIMKLKLSTVFMRSIVSKLIERSIRKKYGCKVKIHLDDLDVVVINGDATIKVSAEATMNNKEFNEIIKKIM